MSEASEANSATSSRTPAKATRPTLEGLLANHGRELPSSLVPTLRLAVTAHAQRLRDNVADREALNRSTALWALLVMNPDVELLTAEGHLNADDLQKTLGITVVPGEEEGDLPSPITLDDTLARALQDHLSTISSNDLNPLEVTAAILLSCARAGGLLPQRLEAMKVELGTATDALARKRSGRPAGLSMSVREARRTLGPDAQVSAAEVAGALIRLQPPKEMEHVRLDLSGGGKDAIDAWLTRVCDLYDAGEVLHSERGIIDKELVLRGLIQLEPTLAEQVNKSVEASRWIEKIRPSPVIERRTEPSVDVPAQTDLLGRETLAKTLLRQLELIGQRGESSMLVHLDGPWGSGKSSLFVFLEHAIAKAEKDSAAAGSGGDTTIEGGDRYLVVPVNAWREQRVGAQWWTLYRALREAHLGAAKAWHRRLASRLGHLWDVIAVRRDKLWPVLLSLLVLMLGSVLVVRFGLDTGLNLATGLSIVVVVTTGLSAAYRFLVPVSPKSAKAMVENSTNPMAEVRDLFARSVQRASPRRVIFLIDDLDRCEPAYVIQFLEVLQTLVRDAPLDVTRHRSRTDDAKSLGPYAVVAADGRWLRASYEKAYGDLVRDDVPGKPLGYRFLEKIFQMHIRLPTVEAATKQRYYESLLFPTRRTATGTTAQDDALARTVTAKIASVRTTEDLSRVGEWISRVADPAKRQSLRSDALEHAVNPAVVERQQHELAPFADLLDSNPRTIRLFVNAVSMEAYLRFLEGASFELAGLALWAVLEARWPALADHLRENPDHVETEGLNLEGNDDMPADLLKLLTGPDVAAVLRNPRWQEFTSDRVRASTG